MDLVLEHHLIERESNRIGIYSFFWRIFSFNSWEKFFTRSIKKSMRVLSADVEQLDDLHEKVSELKQEELVELFSQIKKLNKSFDKMHDKVSSINYMNDSEVQDLFKTISRKLHKSENLLHRYHSKNSLFTRTPDHIKSQISNFSTEAITKTLHK
ncbi:MAG: hypothetical protein WBJ10_17530 [Daejeonella sp.]|uniref:hypothetical protein n=1 Tax=Daejeonella sp. TaxID=2805397 RepID=UPI003C71AF5A